MKNTYKRVLLIAVLLLGVSCLDQSSIGPEVCEEVPYTVYDHMTGDTVETSYIICYEETIHRLP